MDSSSSASSLSNNRETNNVLARPDNKPNYNPIDPLAIPYSYIDIDIETL